MTVSPIIDTLWFSSFTQIYKFYFHSNQTPFFVQQNFFKGKILSVFRTDQKSRKVKNRFSFLQRKNFHYCIRSSCYIYVFLLFFIFQLHLVNGHVTIVWQQKTIVVNEVTIALKSFLGKFFRLFNCVFVFCRIFEFIREIHG